MAQETQQQKAAREQAEKTSIDRVGWPADSFGTPMTRISVAAAELVPTVQFGNATIGPVVIERFVMASSDEQLLDETRKVIRLCEQVVAEERQTLQQQIQARLAGK